MRNLVLALAAASVIPAAAMPPARADTSMLLPVQVPGRSLPVVREHTYRMAGRVRLLLLWVGRDDVGSGVIRWRENADGRAFEVLIGSDPQRAPSQLNKWGYLVEETRNGTTSVVGIISQENDERLSDVKADLKKRQELRAFDTIRGAVGGGAGIARVGTLHAPSHLTYHDADAVLGPFLADATLPLKQVERRAGVRPGFLSALTELIDASIVKRDLQRVTYVHGDRLFELRRLETTPMARYHRDGRTFERVIRGRFETGQAGARTGTRFELVYGAAGPLTGIPILISYQPKWWLQVDLVLHT